MKRLIGVILLGFLLQGCLEEFAPNVEGFAWVNPTQNEKFYEDDLVAGVTEVKLTYLQPLTYEPDIDFNSQDVVDCFTLFL